MVVLEATLGFGKGQRRPSSGQGLWFNVRSFQSSHTFLQQLSSPTSRGSSALLLVCTFPSPLTGLHMPLSLRGPARSSPLTKGMQARQDFGAPVPIEADAAHQELLVHRLDLWARAVLPLRHGDHRWLCHSHSLCMERRSTPGKPALALPTYPHLSNPLKRTSPISFHASVRTGSDLEGAG